MEETAGTNVIDSSGNGYTALLGVGAAPTINQTGIVDQCFLFNDANDEYFRRANNDLHNALNGTAFTVEAWIKTDAATLFQGIVGNDNSDPSVDDRSWILAVGSGGQLAFLKLPNGSVTAIGTTTLSLNTWYHVAATYDGANIKLYVNGVLDQTAAATGSLKGTGVTQFILAGATGRNPDTFSGYIDEIAIYTSVLSAARLLAHYNAA
jgi:hypothetical protein